MLLIIYIVICLLMIAVDCLAISIRFDAFRDTYGFVDRIIADIMLVATILATIVVFIFPWI